MDNNDLRFCQAQLRQALARAGKRLPEFHGVLAHRQPPIALVTVASATHGIVQWEVSAEGIMGPKIPNQWSDGVREPRVVLSPEPNRVLQGALKRPLVDCKKLDQRAANQLFEQDAGLDES